MTATVGFRSRLPSGDGELSDIESIRRRASTRLDEGAVTQAYDAVAEAVRQEFLLRSRQEQEHASELASLLAGLPEPLPLVAPAAPAGGRSG